MSSQEAELVKDTKKTKKIDRLTPQAVMTTPAQLKRQMSSEKELREVINEYITSSMVAGKDYGSIKSKTRSGSEFESKPSLLKPGAEKFCGLFKIRPTFRKDNDTVDMLGNKAGIVAYICELVDSQGRVVGEGRGVYKVNVDTDSDFDVNKAVKIAEKRAQVDAVLRTGALSDFFTQDTEDKPKSTPQRTEQPKKVQSSTNVPAPTDNQLKFIKSLEDERLLDAEKGLRSIKTATEASEYISVLLKTPKLGGN